MGDMITFHLTRRSDLSVTIKIVDGIPVRILSVDDLPPIAFAEWRTNTERRAPAGESSPAGAKIITLR